MLRTLIARARPRRAHLQWLLPGRRALLAVTAAVAVAAGGGTAAAALAGSPASSPRSAVAVTPKSGPGDSTGKALLNATAVPSGTVSVTSQQPVTVGGTVTFSYTASAVNAENWVGLYPHGDAPGSVASTVWAYTPDASGTVTLSTAGVAPGTYDAYLLYDNAYGIMAGPVTVTVAPLGSAAAFGTPPMDGEDDPVWDSTPAVQISASDSPISAVTRFLWDGQYLYVLTVVQDDTPFANEPQGEGPGPSELGELNDGVDIWVNWTNSSSASYYNDTGSYYGITRSGVVGTNFLGDGGSDPARITSKVTSTSTQYTVEAAIPWPSIVRPGSPIGLNTSINDVSTDSNQRTSYITWDTTDQYWNSPAGMPVVTPTGGDNNGQIFSNDNAVTVPLKQTAYVPTWPQLASGGGVTYSVADPSVASVSSEGQVTGLSTGATTVTAKASGLPDEQITVDVTVPPGPYGFTESDFTGPGSGLVNPSGVAVAASGDVWVTDERKGDVTEFSPTGARLLAFGKSGSGNGQLREPEAIAAAGGDVYVADTGNNRVEEFTAKGAFVRTVGAAGTGDGQFTSPEGVAVDGSGDLWVSDTTNNRLEEFSSSGSYLKAITGLSGPQGLTFDASGDLWVADTGNYDFGGDAVLEYDPSTGAEITTVDGNYGSAGGTELSNPADVAVDAGGRLYVPEPDYDIVLGLTANGAIADELGAPAVDGNGKLSPAGLRGALNVPQAVAVNAAGDLFTADKDSGRVVEFVPREPVTVTAQPASVTVRQGGTAVLWAAATGNPAPTVQWESKAPGATSFTPVRGATSGTLLVPKVALAQSGTQYEAVFSNTLDISLSPLPVSVSSAAATLTVVK